MDSICILKMCKTQILNLTFKILTKVFTQRSKRFYKGILWRKYKASVKDILKWYWAEYLTRSIFCKIFFRNITYKSMRLLWFSPFSSLKVKWKGKKCRGKDISRWNHSFFLSFLSRMCQNEINALQKIRAQDKYRKISVSRKWGEMMRTTHRQKK